MIYVTHIVHTQIYIYTYTYISLHVISLSSCKKSQINVGFIHVP